MGLIMLRSLIEKKLFKTEEDSLQTQVYLFLYHKFLSQKTFQLNLVYSVDGLLDVAAQILFLSESLTAKV